MTWPLPERAGVAEEGLNADIVATLGTLALVVSVLSMSTNSQAIINTGSDEEITSSLYSATGILERVSVVSRHLQTAKPSRVGALLAAIIVSSFLGLCLIPAIFGAKPVDPRIFCLNPVQTSLHDLNVRLLFSHFLFVSNQSIFYWTIAAPTMLYVVCLLLQSSMGALELFITAAAGIPLAAYTTSQFLHLSQCYTGVDAFFIALCVVLFFVNPKLRSGNYNVTLSASAFVVECRWLAAVLCFFVMLLLPSKLFGAITSGGLCAGFLLALPSFRRSDADEFFRVTSVWHRFLYSAALLLSLAYFPLSFYRMPSSSELQNVIALANFKSFTTLTRLGRLFAPSPSVFELFISKIPSPLETFTLKFALLWTPAALFTRQRSLTILSSVAAVVVVFFGMASAFGGYPNFGAIGVIFFAYKLISTC